MALPQNQIRGEKHHKAKLSEEQVRDIRDTYASARGRMTHLAKKFGVRVPTIYKIVNHVTWRHI